MKDNGSRNLIVLVISVWASLFSFYGFLAYRARLWSPVWAIVPTTKVWAKRKLPLSREDLRAKRGRLLYRQMRCGVCHGPHGEGGVKNPNADPDGAIPNLYDLNDAFTWQDLKEKLRNGAHPAKLDEDNEEPPLVMPSWKEILSREEVDDLAYYLFSLKSPPENNQEEK